ncbi:MAG: Gfo/Idh/MocA family oxidoreductase [Lachnospiraceae bacterium]|nr:Gfo/Idh/MocA family oxidoreductase [Lachnospiraceae bacterium]
MINFKVGILGAGAIAGTIAETLNALEAFEPYAIASRDLQKAEEFGNKYNINKRYGSYEELLADPDVELVYIATPHAFHAEQAKMCINAGKPCLVEKSFTHNAATAQEVIELSEEKNVFCAEAMWTRCLPMYHLIMEALDKGVIGRVAHVATSIGFKLDTNERIVKPELAGGALLDLGVYPLNYITMLVGAAPNAITSTCMRLETGVDGQETLMFRFPDGKSGTALVTTLFETDNTAVVYGTTGYMVIENVLNPERFYVYSNGQKLLNITKPETQISGYEYEFIAARNAIILGKNELAEMPHSETLRIMRLMDGLRNAWGVKYPLAGEPTE